MYFFQLNTDEFDNMTAEEAEIVAKEYARLDDEVDAISDEHIEFEKSFEKTCVC